MELNLFIEDYKIGLMMILALVVLLVTLRVSGYSPTPPSHGGSDPFAEADFHMAYGLYDEAAQTIRRALTAEPISADLSFKLLEVYFTSGNGDDFLTHARFYKDKFGRSGHWDSIRSMGQELLPDERLFR